MEKCINTEEGVVKETDVLDASMYNDVLSSMKVNKLLLSVGG